MTRLRADIRLPPALAATYAAAHDAGQVPPLAHAAHRGMREELADAGIEVPAETTPSQQALAARSVYPAQTQQNAKSTTKRRVPRCSRCNRTGHNSTMCADARVRPPPPAEPPHIATDVYAMCRAKWVWGHRRMCNLDKGHPGQHQAGRHAWTGP